MAKSYKAYGEIEITDISDSKQLTSLIESQLQRQVIYDPNDRVYLPNYATTNNILTPQLFITGDMNNIASQAKSVSWFYQVNSIGNKIPITGSTTDYTLNTTTKQLTIKTNVLQNNISMNYIVEIIYTDQNTGMDVKTVSQIELVKITNGVDGVDGDNPVVAVLSNESHTIPSDANGLNMNFSGANTEIKIYDGVRDATSEWIITAMSSTGVVGNLATSLGFIYTVTNMTLDSGYVDFTAKKGSITLTKRFTLTKVRKGSTGADGRTPVKGTDYFDGINGQDGKSSFLWVMYSQNANGSGMIESSTNAKYIGVATTQTNIRPSSNTNYFWSLIKGTDGIKGETGADGKTSYLHIKYSDNGTSFTSNNGETMGSWIGTYVDFVEADSTTFSSYSWTLIKGDKGEAGSNAQILYLSSDAEAMTFDGLNNPSPVTQTISITAKLQNITGTPAFVASPYNQSGAKLTDITLGGTGTTRTLTQSQWLSTFAKVVITVTLGSLTDKITIVRLSSGADGRDGLDGSNGADAIVGYLTNESVTLGASPTGVVSDFSSTSGVFKVFDGLVDKTGTASVVYAKISNTGCTATIGSNGAYSVSAMTTDTATVIMTATYKAVVITKTLVLSKSKTGTTGESATAYWLTNSVGVIKRNDAGTYIPTTITVNSLSQKGTEIPTPYSGRFIISETINGTTWVDKYTSSVNESTKIYTPSAGILSLRVRMYLSGGVTSLVDEQNIPVVADGSDPIFAVLTTPLGSIIKNSTGNLTIEANLYKGGTLITPSSYKWYKLDTTVSGGWRQLTASVPDGTTGYTGRILTVIPSSITSLATFKVEAIYNGLTYSNMITLTDLSDPISCIIIGSGIYKNGQGTNSYIARLYRNGSEIDVSGTIYLYKWNLLNKDGTLNAGFTATGKTISIPATAFDDTAQLKCDVDDKK